MLDKLQRKIRIKFKNSHLLQTAFIHKSYVNEHRGEIEENNERLEFLGDAVLELAVTEYLYNLFPQHTEGELTSLRSALVKGKHLAEVARCLSLGEYLLLSCGEEKSKGREKNYILANTVEALIGAIYLDRGFDTAHKFINDFILANLGAIIREGLHIDSKSRLQEITQEKYGVTPVYKVMHESGPDHNKIYDIEVYVQDKLVGKGSGSSKQKAEQDAAVDVLKNKKV